MKILNILCQDEFIKVEQSGIAKNTLHDGQGLFIIGRSGHVLV
jgi:hypothetical protein